VRAKISAFMGPYYELMMLNCSRRVTCWTGKLMRCLFCSYR